MPVNIFVSGPIRPTSGDVVGVINTLRGSIPNSKVFLCTWKGQVTREVRSAVDYAWEVEEPSIQFIQQTVTARTRQQRELHPELEKWTYSIYRMFEGVRILCELARPYCDDEDVTIRIRTDAFFFFEGDYLKQLIESAEDFYTVRNRKTSGSGFDDWFAIAKYKHIRRAWTIEDYNKALEEAWNAEDILLRSVKKWDIPIRFMDYNRVYCFIRLPGGKNNYHA